MRVLPLLTMTLPLAMLVPLAAQAAWPEGARQQYMSDCVATATQTVSKEKATAHCECGAQVIDKKIQHSGNPATHEQGPTAHGCVA